MLPAGNREKKLQSILNVFTFAFFFFQKENVKNKAEQGALRANSLRTLISQQKTHHRLMPFISFGSALAVSKRCSYPFNLCSQCILSNIDLNQ